MSLAAVGAGLTAERWKSSHGRRVRVRVFINYSSNI
jgi:hypothetical protein